MWFLKLLNLEENNITTHIIMMKKITLYIFLLLFTTVQAQYTFQQIDIWSGSNGSSPKYITEHNGKLYFQAFEITPSFKKLYVSDGTDLGTSIVAPNLNGGAGYSPESLTSFNGELYFTAFVSGIGTEIYKTDGTEAGTQLLKDVRSGSSSGLDFNTNNDKEVFLEYNGELYFRGSTASSIELWKTNGTTTGTVSLKNFEDTTNGAPVYFSTAGKQKLGTVYNGLLYFTVLRGSTHELWKTDGTTANTQMVKGGLNGINDLKVFNNLLYFVSGADSDGFGSEIWTSDGTLAGTALKFDIFPNNLNPFFGLGSNPSDFFIFNNELYFSARSYNSTTNQIIGRELWKTDGVTVNLIKDINTDNLASGINSPKFTIYNNELYFSASDNTTSDQELWKTDGTTSGTIKAVSTTATGESLQFFNATIYNGKLFYHNFQQLWVTNGTAAGTFQLTNSTQELIQTSSGSLVLYNQKLWFTALKTGNGNELTSLFDSTLHVIDFNTPQISVYPNPTQSQLHINALVSPTKYTIYNVLGKLITENKVDPINNSIDVTFLKKGIYIINFIQNQKEHSFKFIKI